MKHIYIPVLLLSLYTCNAFSKTTEIADRKQKRCYGTKVFSLCHGKITTTRYTRTARAYWATTTPVVPGVSCSQPHPHCIGGGMD
jgi:hypothetical protein